MKALLPSATLVLVLLYALPIASLAASGDNLSEPPTLPFDISSWFAFIDGSGSNGVNGQVLAMEIVGTSIYVGGTFTNAGGLEDADYIARWDTELNSWSALGSGANDVVRDIQVGDSTEIYVCGDFTSPASRISKWDGMSWSAVGSGLIGQVYAMDYRDGELYAGGEFIFPANRIAKWDGSSWRALGAGMNDGVRAITIDSDGAVYVGGLFQNGGGVPGANHLAVWSDGSWSTVIEDGTSSPIQDAVSDLALVDSTLFIAGVFSNAGGIENNSFLSRWNLSSQTWEPLEAQPDGAVLSVLPLGNRLYAGGLFTGGGGLALNNVGRYEDGTWHTVGDGVGQANAFSSVFDMVILDTVLYVGGNFTSAGPVDSDGMGLEANNLAYYDGITALPVTLTAFTATSISGGHLLEWETSQEQLVEHFLVETSTDLVHWSSLTQVLPQGPSFYQYHRINPAAGLNAYRLKIMDLDGSWQYSPIRQITAPNREIQIYPNPADATLFIDGFTELNLVRIYDFTGMLLSELVAQSTIDISGLSPGSYLIQVGSETGIQTQVFTKK